MTDIGTLTMDCLATWTAQSLFVRLQISVDSFANDVTDRKTTAFADRVRAINRVNGIRSGELLFNPSARNTTVPVG
jgi:hypothetical protein